MFVKRMHSLPYGYCTDYAVMFLKAMNASVSYCTVSRWMDSFRNQVSTKDFFVQLDNCSLKHLQRHRRYSTPKVASRKVGSFFRITQCRYPDEKPHDVESPHANLGLLFILLLFPLGKGHLKSYFHSASGPENVPSLPSTNQPTKWKAQPKREETFFRKEYWVVVLLESGIVPCNTFHSRIPCANHFEMHWKAHFTLPLSFSLSMVLKLKISFPPPSLFAWITIWFPVFSIGIGLVEIKWKPWRSGQVHDFVSFWYEVFVHCRSKSLSLKR